MNYDQWKTTPPDEAPEETPEEICDCHGGPLSACTQTLEGDSDDQKHTA